MADLTLADLEAMEESLLENPDGTIAYLPDMAAHVVGHKTLGALLALAREALERREADAWGE